MPSCVFVKCLGKCDIYCINLGPLGIAATHTLVGHDSRGLWLGLLETYSLALFWMLAVVFIDFGEAGMTIYLNYRLILII